MSPIGSVEFEPVVNLDVLILSALLKLAALTSHVDFVDVDDAAVHAVHAQMTTYRLEARVAFHIWRPVINENLMKHWFPKQGTKVRVYVCGGFFQRFVRSAVVVEPTVHPCHARSC